MVDPIDDKYLKNKDILKFIQGEIDNMKWEIEQSEAGSRAYSEDPKDYRKMIYVGNNSTFPDYLQDVFNGSGTAKKFIDAVKRGSGPVWKRIASVALERLLHGYQNHHGYDGPNDDFVALASTITNESNSKQVRRIAEKIAEIHEYKVGRRSL